MRRNNKKLITSLVILLILSIGIVYAYLTSNLSITGATRISSNTWDIHFENLVINPNSVDATTTAAIARPIISPFLPFFLPFFFPYFSNLLETPS